MKNLETPGKPGELAGMRLRQLKGAVFHILSLKAMNKSAKH